MHELSDKVAIVTGASAGIGAATAKLFAREGAKVIVAARRGAELEELVREIAQAGGDAALFAGDVTHEPFAEALVRFATETYGGVDIAFNNVGTLGPMVSTIDVALEDWNDTLATNLTSAFLGAKYQIPAMVARGGGSLIFTSTFVGYTAGFPGLGTYAASKSGLIGLTQALAVEHGEQGVRVNALLPGATDTAMFREHNGTAEAQSFIANLTAMRRIAQPEEIARSALYLAATATFSTGTALLVDGGVSINRT